MSKHKRLKTIIRFKGTSFKRVNSSLISLPEGTFLYVSIKDLEQNTPINKSITIIRQG